jgi:hypothetical protein
MQPVPPEATEAAESHRLREAEAGEEEHPAATVVTGELLVARERQVMAGAANILEQTQEPEVHREEAAAAAVGEEEAEAVTDQREVPGDNSRRVESSCSRVHSREQTRHDTHNPWRLPAFCPVPNRDPFLHNASKRQRVCQASNQ